MTDSAFLWFRAWNARSYRDDTTLWLSQDRYARQDNSRLVPTVGTSRPTPVVPVVGIFGANASGKSSLLRAMADMRALVLNSFRTGRIEQADWHSRDCRATMGRVPFRLSDPSDSTFYSMHLLLDGVHWAYGFELDDTHIMYESARHWPRGRDASVFYRKGDSVEWGRSHRSTARSIEAILSNDALVLSADRRFRGASTAPLFDWFKENLWLADANNRALRIAYTVSLLAEGSEAEAEWVQRLLRLGDIARPAPSIRLERESRHPSSEAALRVVKTALSTMRSADWRVTDDALVPLDFMLRLVRGEDDGQAFSEESAGTQEWVSLVGVVAHALSTGTTILVDELDRSLHPRLVELLVRLFQSKEDNPLGAQIIFTTNDPSLFGRKGHRILAPHQIRLTERRDDGASVLCSLEDYAPRAQEDMQERYLSGLYGGIPALVETAGVGVAGGD